MAQAKMKDVDSRGFPCCSQRQNTCLTPVIKEWSTNLSGSACEDCHCNDFMTHVIYLPTLVACAYSKCAFHLMSMPSIILKLETLYHQIYILRHGFLPYDLLVIGVDKSKARTSKYFKIF